MSAAAVEHPSDGGPESLLDAADRLMEQLPGYRVEIIGGVITVAPPADGEHAEILTDIMLPFLSAGLHGKESKLLQGIGVWLPGGPQDYAIPDFAVVDADFRDHVVEHKCYEPAIFRLVAEVTSSNYNSDLRAKVAAYAEAKIPVYVIINRKHGRVHVLTNPLGDEYERHEVYAPGQQVTLPESIGAEVTLDATELLKSEGHTP